MPTEPFHACLTCSSSLCTRAHVGAWVADYAPYVLEDHPLLRTLTVELRTVCAYDLSGCGSLRALNLTLWQVRC